MQGLLDLLTGGGGEGNPFAVIFNLLFFVFIIFSIFYGQRIQQFMWLKQIERALIKLDRWQREGKIICKQRVANFSDASHEEVFETIEGFLEFFLIMPVDRDPSGVLGRLEHLLDVRKTRFEDFVSRVAPKANEADSKTLENVIEATIAVFFIFRLIRHFLLLGKKTKSTFLIMQIYMQLPLIMIFAKAYFEALKCFAEGKPIGDGIGPLVAARLMRGGEPKEVAKEVVAVEKNINNRNVIIVKAKGPGGTVGKPGLGVKNVIDEKEGKVARVIMIDAALKFEGEETGQVIEGVGAAIGDPGPEKHKIEESGVKYNIPIDAIIVKQSIEDALTSMKKSIAMSVDDVLKRIHWIINNQTNEGDTVIVAGIGNTLGVGQ
ncbi:MAG: DUF1512 domain-containing protein [Candidatus Lokiarchaeota archaeon]|nr:DUF1512 domain-containing protein [Candidatus Lokiarchaeota archaeon]